MLTWAEYLEQVAIGVSTLVCTGGSAVAILVVVLWFGIREDR